MLLTAASILLPDPMHLEGWEEQDEPLATDRHSDGQDYCFMALRYLLNPDGHYVSKDRWLRMDPAKQTDKLLPDLLIALHVLEQQWNVNEYLPWEVGKAPEVLGEFLSPTSEGADKVGKPKRYAELGVREYFLFDPDGTYGVPRIQGWTLRRDGGRDALLRRADGGVASRVLPVRFLLVDNHVGVIDARTGRLALRYEEVQRLLREEAAARYTAEQARHMADQARNQAEQAQLRAEQLLKQEAAARQQEAEARIRAERARQQEAEARAAAEAEVARLRAELDRLRQAAEGDGAS